MSKKNKNNEVGYGRPPKRHRFKKGQSGNPRGRPKGTKNLATDLRDELNERVKVNDGGKPRRITKQRISVKRLVHEAMKGNIVAFKTIFGLAQDGLEIAERETESRPLTADEQETLADLMRRLQAPNEVGGAPSPVTISLSSPPDANDGDSDNTGQEPNPL
jgi:hypothetical protein